LVPCHRVVAADLSLGGFNGCSGGTELARKRALLEAESACFAADGRLACAAVISILPLRAAAAVRSVADRGS